MGCFFKDYGDTRVEGFSYADWAGLISGLPPTIVFLLDKILSFIHLGRINK